MLIAILNVVFTFLVYIKNHTVETLKKEGYLCLKKMHVGKKSVIMIGGKAAINVIAI